MNIPSQIVIALAASLVAPLSGQTSRDAADPHRVTEGQVILAQATLKSSPVPRVPDGAEPLVARIVADVPADRWRVAHDPKTGFWHHEAIVQTNVAGRSWTIEVRHEVVCGDAEDELYLHTTFVVVATDRNARFVDRDLDGTLDWVAPPRETRVYEPYRVRFLSRHDEVAVAARAAYAETLAALAAELKLRRPDPR